MLEVRGLVTGYGRLEVLHGVDLAVADGELLAVLGANGAGKTTLLRAVSGLLRPTAGGIRLDGAEVAGQPAEKLAGRGLAHVPEGRLVFPTLPVEDNLTLGGYARRRDRAGRAHFAADRERVLELFPRLRRRLGQPAGTLSGGEQQMLAVGRGLMARPRLLLLDEPSLGLAPRIVAEIMAVLARLRRDAGLAILLVEQNVHAAFSIADRVCVLDRGRVAMEGDPDALAGDPRVQSAYLGGGYAAAGTKEGP